MENQINQEEFEVTFNYQNVLFICQVSMVNQENNRCYDVEYFSPNEKGRIECLKGDTNHAANATLWSADRSDAKMDFLQILGKAIEEHGT